MSTPLFLLLSLPVGAIFLGLFWLIAKLLGPLVGPQARKARLQRRLERRLARGDDRYFEELRSIEAAIATNARMAAQPRLDLRRWPYSLLLPLFVLWLGIVLLSMISLPSPGTPPGWTHHFGTSALMLTGLCYMLSPNLSVFQTRRTALTVGAIFTALGGILFAAEMWRHVTI
jgi:hypothetical protein